MCLAVPMRVIKISKDDGDFTSPPVATVDLHNVRKEVRLDIIDRRPEIGDYVLVHAGFAIHVLSAEDAEINLHLLQRMTETKQEDK